MQVLVELVVVLARGVGEVASCGGSTAMRFTFRRRRRLRMPRPSAPPPQPPPTPK